MTPKKKETETDLLELTQEFEETDEKWGEYDNLEYFSVGLDEDLFE